MPADFYLFPKLKEFLRECKFTEDEDVMCMANGWLKEREQLSFYNGIRALENHWTKCVSVSGDHAAK